MKISNSINSNQFLKSNQLLILMFFFFLCSSCGPMVQYLGDSYPSTTNLDVYYDEKDVEKEYKTIGKMTHGNMFDYEVDTIKEKMIQKAKAKGADGIVFMDVENVRNIGDDDDFLDDDRLSITAKVIKYK